MKNLKVWKPSPPRRGEIRTLSAVVNRGGLLNNEPNDEECDATTDAQ